jgi:hypothetical protein
VAVVAAEEMTINRLPKIAQCTASVVSVNSNTSNKNTTTYDNSVVSEIMEHGSQNGRSFGCGAFGNN